MNVIIVLGMLFIGYTILAAIGITIYDGYEYMEQKKRRSDSDKPLQPFDVVGTFIESIGTGAKGVLTFALLLAIFYAIPYLVILFLNGLFN